MRRSPAELQGTGGGKTVKRPSVEIERYTDGCRGGMQQYSLFQCRNRAAEEDGQLTLVGTGGKAALYVLLSQ